MPVALYVLCGGVFEPYDSAGVRAACGLYGDRGRGSPEFRPISACRKWPLEAVNEVVVQVGRFAGAAGGVQWGNGSTDGTNIQGHASRHQAMSSGYMPKEVARLRAEIEAWVTHADWQDEAEDAA